MTKLTQNEKMETIGDIMTSNIVIAKFMGVNITKRNGEPSVLSDGSLYAEYFRVTGFNTYHSDWNMLMPVVEKIERLAYSINISKRKCTITTSDFNSFHIDVVESLEDTKHLSTYASILLFIKQYTPES